MYQACRQALPNVDLRTAASMALNFASSTLLIVINKVAMDKYSFHFATTLTAFHLFSTFVLLLPTALLGFFQFKRLPLNHVSKLAAGTMGFITLTNLSLQHNSVGFYQVMKVMTTPTVVLIESLLYRRYLETNLKLSLIPVCAGVIITTVTDFRLNFTGTVYAVAAVIVSAFYQIWCGSLQKSLDCNALQLQAYVAPLAMLFILPLVPILDNWSPADPSSIWHYSFDHANMLTIAITGLFGFLVNVSIFLVIGRSSPLSYNILGHCKTAVIVLSDFLLFGRPFTFKSTVGVALTLLGVFAYTSIKLQKTRQDDELQAAKRTEPDVHEDTQEANADDDVHRPLTKSQS